MYYHVNIYLLSIIKDEIFKCKFIKKKKKSLIFIVVIPVKIS